MPFLGKYAKTVSAVVIGLLGWGAQVVNSESTSITANEWIALGTAVATAVGVFAVKNSGE